MIKRPEKGLAARVEPVAATLTPGEKRIADILLANPHEAAFLGVEELARRSDSSVATAVRFAKKLGYTGYLEMRKSLVSDARRHYRRGPTARHPGRGYHCDPFSSLRRFAVRAEPDLRHVSGDGCRPLSLRPAGCRRQHRN